MKTPRSKSPVTLKDIATKLKISTVTVSKALRNHPDISLETERLVKITAARLGYFPNYLARNLSLKRSSTLGVIVPKMARYFFAPLVDSMYDYAFENHYEIILAVSQENPEREVRYIETLLSMRVDGLIVSISEKTVDYNIFNKVKNYGIPLIFVGRIVGNTDFSNITIDNRGGTFKAIEHAIKIGYTRIGFIGGDQRINTGKNRYLGYQDAMIKYNLAINPTWVVNGGFDENDGYSGFMKIFHGGILPEFIFAITYQVAVGIYAAVNKLGLKIPDDIDIMCFGNSTTAQFLSPSLSCVEQPIEELGKKAVELIIEKINNFDSYKTKNIELPTNLLLRETCSAQTKLLNNKRL